MNTVLIVLMIVSYLVSAFILLTSATLGFVSTKKNVTLAIALMLFVLPPFAFMWAKVVVPILLVTLIGYEIVCVGVCIRGQLFVWRDQLLEEIKKNLSNDQPVEN